MKKLHVLITTIALIVFCQQTSAQAVLWGTTQNGGNGGFGSIYGLPTGTGTISALYTFSGNAGQYPWLAKCAQAANGKIYGTHQQGGIYNNGVLWEYDPATLAYTIKKHYNTYAGPDGGYPNTVLTTVAGKVYGFCQNRIFEYNASTDTYTTLYNMSNLEGSAGGGGNGFILGASGKLYALCAYGGANGNGTIIEFDLATNILTVKFDFPSNFITHGQNQWGQLAQAANGRLYGTSYNGGINDRGILWEFNLSTLTFVKLFDFGGANGEYPYFAGVTVGSNGKLYGTTYQGGTNTIGILFEYNIATSTFTKKLDFTGSALIGGYPVGTLLLAANGRLYGNTISGGTNGYGILYEYDVTTSTFTKKIDYTTQPGTGQTYSSLMQASSGLLYATGYVGGNSGIGCFYEANIVTNIATKRVDFGPDVNGGTPNGGLTKANNGKFYGLTQYGGVNGKGLLFEYDPATGVYTVKASLSQTMGYWAMSSMLKASNGKLYGLLYQGGNNGAGTIIEYDVTTNTLTKKIDLLYSNGGYPYGNSLMQAANGKLYGMTQGGGTNTQGVIFEYDIPTNVYTKKYDFVLASDGGYPYGNLVQASNGLLYGQTQQGGTNSYGTFFHFNLTTNVFTKDLDFTTATGAYPQGSPMIANNGLIYGITSSYGTYGAGTLYEFNTSTSTYSVKINLDGTTGYNFMGQMLQSVNNKLYGAMSYGGNYGGGTVFEYDIPTNTIVKTFDFNSLSSGINPGRYQLIETCGAATGPGTITSNSIICNGTPTNFSVTAVPNATNYVWYIPPGATLGVGAGNAYQVLFNGVVPGTYTVGVSAVNICGTSTISVKTITVIASPTVNSVANPTAICNGNTASLTATGAVTFTWSTGAFTSSVLVSPSVTSIYTVTGGAANTCTTISQVTLVVNQNPTISVNSGSICSGTSFTMVPSGANTFTFQGGSAIVSPTTNASYTVVGTGTNGCVSPAFATSNITVSASPTISVNSGSICSGTSFTMVPSGANTFTFQGGSAVVSPTTSASYTVIGTSTAGCVSPAFATSNLTVNANPTISLNSGSICSGNSFTMVPSGANTFTFQGGSAIVSPTTNASYTVIGTNTLGCVSPAFATSNITVSASPTISVNSGSICSGTSFTMVPSGANTFTFQGGSAVVSPTTNSSYTVIGTSTAGCISPAFATSNITVNANPTITVNSGSICVGNSFTMIPSGANTFTFQGGSPVVSPTTNASYTVIGTSTAGCVSPAFATSNLTVNANPTISVNSGSICSGNSFTMAPSGANTYTFEGGNAVVSPTTNTSYTVIGTNTLGCVSPAFATSNITVSASPTISVNSGSICSGTSFTMVPSGANTFTFQGGSAVVSPTTNASYTVVGTSTAGCISPAFATSNITVSASPTISVNSGSICSGDSFTMVPNGANTYTFQGGSAIVSPTSNASYTVIGTTTAGCVSPAFATSNLTVNANPTISVNSGSICLGNSFTMTPSGANTYTFEGGAAVVSPTANASYTVIGTNTLGCVSPAFATSSVTVDAAPLPTISVNSGSICANKSFTIIPSGANSYTFEGGGAIVSPTANATYTVIGTNTAGCISQTFATSSVSVVALPLVSVTGNSAICIGESATFIATGADTYSWNTGAVTSSIIDTPTITSSYSVIGTSSLSGCSVTNTLNLVVDPCTGLNKLVSGKGLSLQIYPNPNAGVFSIVSSIISTNDDVKMQITNALGQILVLETKVNQNSSVNIQQYPSGIYFVKLVYNGKEQTVKLIKE